MELILKSISNQHSSESQDNDQPDYDSVASDEDTDLETNAAKSNRQKVGLKYLYTDQMLFIEVIGSQTSPLVRVFNVHK